MFYINLSNTTLNSFDIWIIRDSIYILQMILPILLKEYLEQDLNSIDLNNQV